MKESPDSGNVSETSSVTTAAETLASATIAECFSEEDSIATHVQHNRVSFGSVCIREYQRTLGDNPAVSSGPPLSLDWEYNPDEQILSVEEYEQKKDESGKKKQVRALSRFKREKILEEDFGISRLEMKASMREVTNIQKLRKISYESRNSEKSTEIMEALQRKVGTALGLRKSQKKQLKKLLKGTQECNSSGTEKNKPKHRDKWEEVYSFDDSSLSASSMSASMSTSMSF